MTEHRTESAMILPTTTITDDDTVHAAVAMLPVGSFEQHGPYLPLVTDTLIATAIGDAISSNYNVFKLPPITFGCSQEHSDFPGTLSISATTLAAVVGDICRSLRQQDIHALVVVNGHGGNYVLANIAQEANTDNAIKLGLYPSRNDWTEARHAAGMSSTNHDDMHAGELETSILLASHPTYVREGWHSGDHTASDRRYLSTLGISAYTTSGVIGYPSRANADKGYLVLNHLGQAAGKLITLLTDRQI